MTRNYERLFNFGAAAVALATALGLDPVLSALCTALISVGLALIAKTR